MQGQVKKEEFEKTGMGENQVRVRFKAQGGKAPHKLEDKEIHLTWDEKGRGKEYVFDYPGSLGWMMIPFANLFETLGHLDDQNQFYMLTNEHVLILKLKDKAVIRDEQPNLPLDGSIICGLAIFDRENMNYAVKNSPPPIKVGP